VRGFKTRFHLYTVPWQLFYEASRKLILKGDDGRGVCGDSPEYLCTANFETHGKPPDHLNEHNLISTQSLTSA